jgi:phospholipid/cholesterol/gamma-HCH transport system permease protein
MFAVWLPPYEFSEIKKHIKELGIKSLPLISIIGFIIGLILTMQSRPILSKFGAAAYLPVMVSISVVRELGPVIGALIVAGRVSSGIGAELGSMRVTEQIDALEVSAVDPFNYLVVTRVLSCMIILPVLTVYLDFLAIFGAYVAIVIEASTTWLHYLDTVIFSLTLVDVIPNVLKTIVFGFIIGIVGSYYGYNTAKGTEGVGKAATISVVIASFCIIFFDLVLIKVIQFLFE